MSLASVQSSSSKNTESMYVVNKPSYVLNHFLTHNIQRPTLFKHSPVIFNITLYPVQDTNVQLPTTFQPFLLNFFFGIFLRAYCAVFHISLYRHFTILLPLIALLMILYSCLSRKKNMVIW